MFIFSLVYFCLFINLFIYFFLSLFECFIYPLLYLFYTNDIVWGCSSDGRAFALHARGSGIDARHLHFFLRFIVIWVSLLFFSLLVKVSLVKLFKYLHMFCVVVGLSLLVSVVWIVSIVHCFFLSFFLLGYCLLIFLFIYLFIFGLFFGFSIVPPPLHHPPPPPTLLYLLCHLIPLLIDCYSEISVSIVG